MQRVNSKNSGKSVRRDIGLMIGAFGNPDAARPSSDDDFINIDGVIQSPEIDLDVMRKRVIVGRKGSGKSLYLRWHRRSAESRGLTVLADPDLLNTRIIASVDAVAKRDFEYTAELGLAPYIDSGSYIISFWNQLWNRAVFLSVASIAINKWKEINLSDYNRIASRYNGILLSILDDKERSPTNCLQLIHHNFDFDDYKGKGWKRYIDHPDWSLLRSELSRICRDLSPIALYIDAIDDDFESAPIPWLHCQAGLFKFVFESLYREESLSNRLHVVIAIRDTTFSGIAQYEHGSRYLTDSRIYHLKWDVPAVREFLFEKIRRIPRTAAASPMADPRRTPFAYWLGFEQVHNRRRKSTERISDYILRHTRMLPRDVVIMGNAIADRMARRIYEGKPVSDAPLRQRVAEVASFIAHEAIHLCVQELVMSPEYMSEVILQDWKESKSGQDALNIIKSTIEERCMNFFEIIGKEIFTRDELEQAMIASGLALLSHMGQTEKLFRFDNLLWRHGLLAVQVHEGFKTRWRFNWQGIFESPEVDINARLYGFHSILIDLYHLEICPEGPVF